MVMASVRAACTVKEYRQLGTAHGVMSGVQEEGKVVDVGNEQNTSE